MLTRTSRGTYTDPASRSCFVACASCHRCDRRAHDGCPLPNSCSGRPDPEGMRIPHPDDLCRCKEGTMVWVTKEGRVITRKYKSSPFESQVKTDTQNQDDRDWSAYLNEQRERLDNPEWDPIQFTDGSSTTDWSSKYRAGK